LPIFSLSAVLFLLERFLSNGASSAGRYPSYAFFSGFERAGFSFPCRGKGVHLTARGVYLHPCPLRETPFLFQSPSPVAGPFHTAHKFLSLFFSRMQTRLCRDANEGNELFFFPRPSWSVAPFSLEERASCQNVVFSRHYFQRTVSCLFPLFAVNSSLTQEGLFRLAFSLDVWQSPPFLAFSQILLGFCALFVFFLALLCVMSSPERSQFLWCGEGA